MRSVAALLLAGCLGAVVHAEPVVLQSMGWFAVADSLEIDFAFANDRPTRFRVATSPDTARERSLLLEFSGAVPGAPPRLKLPKWAQILSGSEPGTLAVRIRLDAPTPWKADWEGNTLRMHILDRVKDSPVWKNPWVIGGLGGALLGGGVMFWLLGEHGRPVPGDGVIPPPDVVFPQ